VASGPSPAYRVVYLESVQGTLRSLAEKAVQRGLRAAFAAVLRHLDADRHSSPLDLGEPVFNLPHLRMQVRLVGNEFLYLRFAVDAGRQIVYVNRCAASDRLAD
jgi:hypothetical protein